jgi:hypothetical protein
VYDPARLNKTLGVGWLGCKETTILIFSYEMKKIAKRLYCVPTHDVALTPFVQDPMSLYKTSVVHSHCPCLGTVSVQCLMSKCQGCDVALPSPWHCPLAHGLALSTRVTRISSNVCFRTRARRCFCRACNAAKNAKSGGAKGRGDGRPPHRHVQAV